MPEHSPRGTLVGNVTGAVDADEGPNAIVYYFIAGGVPGTGAPPALGLKRTLGGPATHPVPRPPAAGNEDKNFHLQPDGSLLVLKDLDRETEAIFSFIVKASSNRSWTPPRGPSPALDLLTDLTLQEVRVVLEDINDQPPRFTKAEYTAGAGTSQGPRAWAAPSLTLMWPACSHRSGHRCQGRLGVDTGAGPGCRHRQQQPGLLRHSGYPLLPGPGQRL